MNVADLSKEEFAALAKEIYYRDIRPQVIDEHRGEFLVLDVESGDYETGEDPVEISNILKERQPRGRRFLIRIGYSATFTASGGLTPDHA